MKRRWKVNICLQTHLFVPNQNCTWGRIDVRGCGLATNAEDPYGADLQILLAKKTTGKSMKIMMFNLWKNIWEVTLRHLEVWDPNCSLFGLHVAGAEAVALCLLFCYPKWRKQHWKAHNNTTCYHNGLRPWSKYVAKFSPVESLHNLGLKIDGMWKGSWKVRFLALTFTWFSWVHLSAK